MLDWAIKKHKRYKKDMGDKYPRGRYAMVPFVIWNLNNIPTLKKVRLECFNETEIIFSNKYILKDFHS